MARSRAHHVAGACVAALLALAPFRPARGQAVNPGVWRPVSQAVADTMSDHALLRLHRRLLAHEDSLIRYGSSLVSHGVPWRRRAPAASGPITTRAYVAVLGAALLYNATCPLGRRACERDAGGYVDVLGSIDKVAHASTAMAITSLAIQGGVRSRDAAIASIAAGVGLEVTQAQGGGYYSARDVVANVTGVAAAWGWATWVDRRRRARSEGVVRARDGWRARAGADP